VLFAISGMVAMSAWRGTDQAAVERTAGPV
jgi:hypothetical protein